MSQPNQNISPVRLLLVEDNPGDVLLTKEAFEESRLHVSIDIIDNGEDALSFLKNPDVLKPDLILLDINLPGISGLEMLSAIKEDEKLKLIPVIVLTTSDANSDILQAYALYANCYITKPVKFEEFQKILRSFEEFWFTIVKLPRA